MRISELIDEIIRLAHDAEVAIEKGDGTAKEKLQKLSEEIDTLEEEG